MSGTARAKQFAKQVTLKRLNNNPAWPMTAFQLECEMAGVYQSTSGTALDELHEAGEVGRHRIRLDGKPRTYFTRPENPPPDPDPVVKEAHRQFEEFISTRSYYANLVAYVTLCKIYDEIGDYVLGFDVYSEGEHTIMLGGTTRKPDAVIRLPNEHVPVEVYNGGDYLGKNTSKFTQLNDLHYDDEGMPSHPLLINRRSDDALKTHARREWNSVVIDTDCMLACETRRDEIEEELDLLHLLPRIDFRPEVETTDGQTFDGETYENLSEASEDVLKLRPPSKMLANWDDVIPDQYMERVRGGVQLQYINSIYRRGHERTRQDACLVLQEMYHILLRAGGKKRDVLLEEGWEQATERYSSLKAEQQRKPAILDEARDLLNMVRDEKMISNRNGQLHARQATHPQQDLTF